MTINEVIIGMMAPVLDCPVAPNLYTGEDDTYMTFNYAATPIDHGANRPGAFAYAVQLHYFFPSGVNPFEAVRGILDAIWGAGKRFVVQRVSNETDLDGQYYLFELECVGGPVYGEL